MGPTLPGAELYFLLFIVLGAFIFMKLFAGAAIDPTFLTLPLARTLTLTLTPNT